MSEIAEKIAEILKDPESLGMINGIAKSLMGDGAAEEPGKEEVTSEPLPVAEKVTAKEKEAEGGGNAVEEAESVLPELPELPDESEVSEEPGNREGSEEKGKSQRELRRFLSGVRTVLENGNIDNTLRLISALKPYMSRERRESAERVQSFLRAVRLLLSAKISPTELAGLLADHSGKR